MKAGMFEALVALGLMSSPALAHPCETGRFVEAVDEDAEIVMRALRRTNGRPVMWRDVARTQDVARTHDVAAYAHDRDADRYGRVKVFVFVDGVLEQERWLRAGRAVAAPWREATACRAALFAAERVAREAGRGVWAEAPMRRANDPTLSRSPGFAVVEGRIVSVGDRTSGPPSRPEGRLYLNFGTVWDEDFTVLLVMRDFRRHPDLVARLKRARGRTVRVRGRIEVRGGAFMRLDDAGQIEID